MNAFNSVNLAAACIITSTDFATELGIQESKWVYPLGGAGATDSDKGKKHIHSNNRTSISFCLILIW